MGNIDEPKNTQNDSRGLRREEERCDGYFNATSGGTTGQSSKGDELQQERSSGKNGQITVIQDTGDVPTAGKIKRALNALKDRHLRYVRAHRSRLEDRLDENLTEENEFLQEFESLVSEVDQLPDDQRLDD